LASPFFEPAHLARSAGPIAADLVRVLLALGLLALMSALDETSVSGSAPGARLESSTR